MYTSCIHKIGTFIYMNCFIMLETLVLDFHRNLDKLLLSCKHSPKLGTYFLVSGTMTHIIFNLHYRIFFSVWPTMNSFN